jgi:hypothetical protein
LKNASGEKGINAFILCFFDQATFSDVLRATSHTAGIGIKYACSHILSGMTAFQQTEKMMSQLARGVRPTRDNKANDLEQVRVWWGMTFARLMGKCRSG